VKGIIFNLAEEVLTQAHGAETWDDILERAGFVGAYTSLGSYPDEELVGLLRAASEITGIGVQTIVRQLGEGAIPLLAARYPQFFAPHTTTRPFVLTVNDIIHPEVRKIYPGADVPEFDFDTSDPNVLALGYRSQRQLCALAEGFIVGAATHYGEEAEVEQTQCMHRGADSCLILCRFRSLATV
jgi:Haem-NO-binding